MISIYLISKVLMVTIIFMTILTSVSTSSKLYQMAKKNETFHDYILRAEESFEEKMNIDDFYSTVHNMNIRHIPEPSKKFDYVEYKRVTDSYCSSEYVTTDYFKKTYKINPFIKAVTDFKICVDKFLTTSYTSGVTSNDYILQTLLLSDLSKDPNNMASNYPYNLMNYITRMNRCFDVAFVKDGGSLEGCFDYEYGEDEHTKKFTKELMGFVKKRKSVTYDSFVSCTKQFQKQYSDKMKSSIAKENVEISNESQSILSTILSTPWELGIPFRKKKTEIRDKRLYFGLQTIVQNIEHEFTLKEILLIRSLIKNYQIKIEHIDLKKMYYVYTQTKEVLKTDLDVHNCRKLHSVMDKVPYTATMMFYTMFPKYLNQTYNDFIRKRKLMLNHLKDIDHQNKTVYKYFLKLNDNIPEVEFTKMLRRRAMNREPNYISYAMRIKNISDYLPLPKHLWNKEKNIANTNAIQDFINQEHIKDCRTAE